MHRKTAPCAFSLIELLVVMALMAIAISLVVPTVGSVTRGSQLSAAGQMLADQCALARQDAVTRNRCVAVRIYQLPSGICGLDSELIQDNGDLAPLRKITWMQENVRLASDPQLTSIASGTFSTSGTVTLPAKGDASYLEFRFRPDGSLATQSFTTATPGLTLVNTGDDNIPPKNFYAVQINPVTGRVEIFRP